MEPSESCRRPWWVAGGWAIDLLVERETRAHEDVEVAILRGDQGTLRDHLRGWRLERVARGSPTRIPWADGEWIGPPDHEVHARSPDGTFELEILLNEGEGPTWRFRGAPRVPRALPAPGVPPRPPDGTFELEILLNEGEGPRWRFRRDPRITRPLALAGMRTADGVPFLAPEIVLPYKAKEPRG